MADTGAGFLSSEWQHTTTNVGGILGAIFRRMYPRDTAKRTEAFLDVDRVTATNLTKGHASERTITKALRAGGWPLLMQLGEAMTGQTYADHLQSVVQEHDRLREQAAARQDHLRRLEERAAVVVSLRPGALDRSAGRAVGGARGRADGLGDGEA